MDFFEFLFSGFIFLFVVFLIVLFSIIGVDIAKSVKNGNGYVHQGRYGTAFKSIIEEKDGCVKFIDVWDDENKTCGSYSISTEK